MTQPKNPLPLPLGFAVTVKMRLQATREDTIRTAQALEAAGCQMLVLQGLRRDERGASRGCGDWTEIAEVKCDQCGGSNVRLPEKNRLAVLLTPLPSFLFHLHPRKNVTIPVVANGDVITPADADLCLHVTGTPRGHAVHNTGRNGLRRRVLTAVTLLSTTTGADAVMCGEALLTNPGMFRKDEEGPLVPEDVLEVAHEYLTLAEAHPVPPEVLRDHFRSLLHLLLPIHKELAEDLAVGACG